MVENAIQIKRGILINVDVSAEIQKNIMCAKKDYIWNPATCTCENGEYLGSIIDDSVITCDDIINAADSVSTNIPTNVTKTVSTNVTSTASIISL